MHLSASKCGISIHASIFKIATRRKLLWVPQGSSAIRKFKVNSVMIQKKKITPFTHSGKCWYYDAPPYPWHFYDKGRYLREMLPLLLILSRCELGSWNKFISWNFLYLGTFLWQRTLYKTVFCCFYWVRLCLELILSHEKKIMYIRNLSVTLNATILKPLLSPQT